ncbi:enoyl-CoA hydratase/isomerase family protein [Brevibacterium daeguense]|uniref:Enoyl-CoA hydratase/isomerase family protein n=1 Tax=Brevibacterium daeguense TaxID=909936 RepID=A0ABP8EFL6_9MICO|nr:enoyl-CoA hydratase [Brevibacterium daeguense]
MSDEILIEQEGHTLTVTFNRPQQRNAMTWEMYEGLANACERANEDDGIRVMVLRGAGGKAFVAGTDIRQFSEFDGDRGVEYEHSISEILGKVAAVDVPVIAAIEGFCVGGGLGIATMADLRIASPGSKFGVPIAKTLGNCLSADTVAALIDLIGQPRTVDLLLTARMMDAEEASRSGFVSVVTDDVTGTVTQLAEQIGQQAPLTMWATKETVRRLRAAARPADVDDSDIVRKVYGSRDFSNAVAAFANKTKPEWTGS